MATIALFHSALGLRPGVHAFADRLREAGHDVHPIDSFDGETFDDMNDGTARRGSLGIPELIRRAQQATAGLSADTVYAGFSMGTGAAELLAATRPGARGALLMSGALDPRPAGIEAWPEGVPAQVHHTVDDPLVDAAEVSGLVGAVQAARAAVEVFTYPGSGHLFADPDLPDYDPEAAELMLERALDFLARV